MGLNPCLAPHLVAEIFSNLQDLKGKKQLVIKTIEEMGNTITLQDVVGKTGFSTSETNILVNQIGSDVGAHLIVSQGGDITYKFEPGFAGKYARKGMRKFLTTFALTSFETVFFLLRMSFGFMLILTFLVMAALVIAAVVALVASIFSDSGGDIGGGGGDIGGGSSLDFGSMDLSSIGDGFNWTYTPGHQRRLEQKAKKGHFFLECFSFLFGDGDPNYKFDEKRWQTIARLLNEKSGVISAEELAPYTGQGVQDERALLAVLAHFDGKPHVTDAGNIIYVFENFKNSPYLNAVENGEPLPRFLEEKYWLFSEYSDESQVVVFIFAGLNLWGSWWLWRHIATIAFLSHYVLIIDVLLAYSSFFLILPLLRIAFIIFANSFIQLRNQKRESLCALTRTAEHRLKAEEMQKLRIEQKTKGRLERSSIDLAGQVYSTEMDLLCQEINKSS